MNYMAVIKELLDGVVYEKPVPSINHARVGKNIIDFFEDVNARTEKLYLDDKNEPIPDIVVGDLDLIVEIMSPETVKNDRFYKKDLYQRHGVKEYWIVDDEKLSVEVYWLSGKEYVLHDVFVMLQRSDTVCFRTTVNGFLGEIIDLKDIFADVYESILERS